MKNTKRVMGFITIIGMVTACMLLGSGCKDSLALPKPKAYPRVIYPERGYKPMQTGYCPLTFEMPVYAEIQQDTLFFNEKPKHPCWFDLYFPDFDARLHCSYVEISKADPFESLRNDAFKMADKHNIKADYIEELPVLKPDGTSGFVFDIEGPVASPFQFYLTDSTHHFFRGSLYFNVHTNPDSLAPVIEFLKVDVMQIVNTLKWQ